MTLTMPTTRQRPTGRGWAYTGITLGGAVSIAANVAHSFIPPLQAPPTWHPEAGAVVGAIVWPVFLFIAVEILARTPWPKRLGWDLLRFGGLLPVAAVAAFVSYKHLSGLLAHYGEEKIVYIIGPLAVDGLMVMATAALLATRPTHTRSAPPTTHTPATPLAAPVTAAVAPSTTPPAPVYVPSPTPVAVPTPTPALVPARSEPAVRTAVPAGSTQSAPVRARAQALPSKPATPASVAVPASPTDTHVTGRHAPNPTRLPANPVLLAKATQHARTHQADTGTPITPGELAVRLRVNSDTAAQLLALVELTDQPKPVTRVNGSPAAV